MTSQPHNASAISQSASRDREALRDLNDGALGDRDGRENAAKTLISLNYAFAKENGLIILDAEQSPVLVGVRGRPDPLAIIEVRRCVRDKIKLELMPDEMFERRLSEIYSVEGINTDGLDLGEHDDLTALAEGLPKTADLLDSQDDAPVIKLINALIAEAVKVKASDIHVEPYENTLSVRLRVDGVLREVLSLPAKMTPVFTSRLKVMARLDIAEKRIPQDGRISLALGGKTVDVRVSTLPARFGERVVMRILDKESAKLDLDRLGMPSETLLRFKKLLQRPNGVILVTGPTGSGKTTTLYGGLSLLNDPGRNILTVEDPVEYAIDGVGQTQINSKVGMTFATGLRAILRQDPDIVMVGEIRDRETAEIAVQASLTGHLVLSTVHTNSAVGAVTRLRDMGVEPFLLSSTLAGAMAQRLVRRLCDSCKSPYQPDKAELVTIKNSFHINIVDVGTMFKPIGCGRCNQSGYEGRIGVYELIIIDEQLKTMIHDSASELAMADYAFGDNQNMSLAQSAFGHVKAGLTSVEEVLRVISQGADNGDL